MDLMPFDLNYIPYPFGLKNLGATCYFNALIQGLITCTSLTEVCIKNKNNSKFTSNPVMLVFIDMINLYHDGLNIINELDKLKLWNKSPKLWYAMISYLKKTGRQKQFGHGQEDSYEGFVMLMQCWENINEIRILFEHTYHANYICPDCKTARFSFNHIINVKYKNIVDKRNEKLTNITKGKKNLSSIEDEDESWVENNTHFIVTSDLTSGNAANIKKKFGYAESGTLQEYIECPKVIHEGITCHNKECNSKRDKLKYSSLAVLPEILVVVIKKFRYNKERHYGEKLHITTNLPDNLTFKAQSGIIINYKPIVQILHSGGLSGGHYWAHGKRRIPGSDKYMWFNLNDGSVSPVQGFISDITSYTVIYHLMP